MLESRSRRIPLVDVDDETKRAMVVSVVTQYRILKFVAVNVHETQFLRKPLSELNLGTYKNLETAKMDTPVMEVIHQLVNLHISSVPILNSDGMQKSSCGGGCKLTGTGVVINVFEAVDVITLIKGGTYDELNLTVGEALQKRSDVSPCASEMNSWKLTLLPGFPWYLHLLGGGPSRYNLRHYPKVSCSPICGNRRRQSTGWRSYT